MSPLAEALLLIMPLLIAGVGHMLIVRFDLFSGLKIPVNAARFGCNKTWRGFAVMPWLTWMGVLLTSVAESLLLGDRLGSAFQSAAALPLGLTLGFAYVLFELPNSFLKRRLGIPPGEPSNEHRVLAFITDHLDSFVGCLIVYELWLELRLETCLLLLVFGPLIHIGINLILFICGLRKEAF